MLTLRFCNGHDSSDDMVLCFDQRRDPEVFEKLGLYRFPYAVTQDGKGGINVIEHSVPLVGIMQRYYDLTGQPYTIEAHACFTRHYLRLEWNNAWAQPNNLGNLSDAQPFVEEVNRIAHSMQHNFPSASMVALGAALQTAREILELIDGNDQNFYALVPCREFDDVPDDDIAGSLSELFQQLNQ